MRSLGSNDEHQAEVGQQNIMKVVRFFSMGKVVKDCSTPPLNVLHRKEGSNVQALLAIKQTSASASPSVACALVRFVRSFVRWFPGWLLHQE